VAGGDIMDMNRHS